MPTRTSIAALIATALLLVSANEGLADVSVLTLDGLSFISFQDEVTNSIPGGTLRFNFGAPNADGSVPFTIAPSDVSLAPVTIQSLDANLQYSLSSTASGVMTPTPSGRKIVFSGTVSAEDLGLQENGVARSYELTFTTEVASAESLDGSDSVEREGVRVPLSARYVQLVGATVNVAENLHGAAVYMVLSGTFDHLP